MLAYNRLFLCMQVKSIIGHSFQSISGLRDWNYLECGQDNRLEIASNQSPGGDVVCSHRGALYLCEAPLEVHVSRTIMSSTVRRYTNVPTSVYRCGIFVL